MLTCAELREVSVSMPGVGITDAQLFQHLLTFDREDAELCSAVEFVDSRHIVFVVRHIAGTVPSVMTNIKRCIALWSLGQLLGLRSRIGKIVRARTIDVVEDFLLRRLGERSTN